MSQNKGHRDQQTWSKDAAARGPTWPRRGKKAHCEISLSEKNLHGNNLQNAVKVN